jgi:drug/metabolite transporter (DMT)-like permease
VNTPAAVALSLASVVAYAAAAAVQHRIAVAPAHPGPFALLARGAWWAAVALNGVGAAVHVAALLYGPLTLVEPLGALTLVAALPLGARTAGRRVGRNEWRGAALTVLGCAALLPVTAGATVPGSGADAAGATAVAVAACLFVPVAIALRSGRPRMLGLAVASGVTSGTASALAQTLVHADDPLAPGSVLTGALTLGLAITGLMLAQAAYAGGLGAPLAVLTLADPVAAAAIGLTVLGERLHGGLPAAALAALGAALASYGVVLLTRPGARPESVGPVGALGPAVLRSQ